VALGIPALLMAEALARALRDCDLRVVGCYVRFPALLEKVRRCRPDIVIVDAAMAAPAFGAPDYLAQTRGSGSRFLVLADELDGALARAVIDHLHEHGQAPPARDLRAARREQSRRGRAAGRPPALSRRAVGPAALLPSLAQSGQSL